MRKDPTEFRERFLRWKNGELVYENGLTLPAYEDGLTPLRKSEVNTNEAAYVPEEDLYKSRYTLPEITVTGDKSKRVYHSHAPRTSGISKNQYKLLTGDLLGAMTTGMNVLSPSLWWGAVRDANGVQDGFNRLMRGNSGFTTEKYAKEHPYISAGMNLAGDAAALGVLNTIKPKPNFVPTLNSNLEGIRYAYSRNPELANIGTIEEYNDYIKTIFPESKVRDINYHMGPKGLQELKPSTGEVHNTNPGAHGIYVTPDKSYSQNLRKYTTDRLEKPSKWTYLKRNLTPGGWDKANEIFTDIYPVMIDTKNPLYTKGTWTWGFKDSKYKSLMDKYDAIVNSGPKWYQNANSMPETIVPKTEQTLILGSDADVAGFRKFISLHKPNVVSKTSKSPVGIDYRGGDTNLFKNLFKERNFEQFLYLDLLTKNAKGIEKIMQEEMPMYSKSMTEGIVDKPMDLEIVNIYNNSVLPRLVAMRPGYKGGIMRPTVKSNVDAALNEGYTVYPDEVFKKAGKDLFGGFLYPDGHISVRYGNEDFALGHEVRHRLSGNFLPETEAETTLLKSAYDDGFDELSKIHETLKGVDMNPERVTTNFDARKQAIGKHHLLNTNWELQNKIIDKLSDERIFEAVEKSNGYGRKYIKYLRDNNRLTPEKARLFREAMKYVGAVVPFAPVGSAIVFNDVNR